MKRFLTILALTIMAGFSSAAAMPLQQNPSLQLRQNSVMAGQRPIFLLVYSQTCNHCASFIQNTLTNPAVNAILNQFQVRAVDVANAGSEMLAYDIDYLGVVPSVHLLNEKGVQMANTMTGNIPPQDLINVLQQFLTLYYTYSNSRQQ